MPRSAIGPRLWFDRKRCQWVILDRGGVFRRTGTSDEREAHVKLVRFIQTHGSKPPRPTPKVPGYIYFVSAEFPDFPIKIGFTESLSGSRLEAIQTGCPYRIVMLAAVEGTYQFEKHMHREFAADRLCGEWFKRSNRLMAAIAAVQETQEKAA